MDHNVLSDPSRWRGPPPPKPPLSAPPIVQPPQDKVPPIPSFEVLLDGAGRLNQDLACRQCGYNLRGLAIAGTCPECQTPIGKSVRPDLLRFAEPRWVERLALGMTLILVAMGIGVVLSVATALSGVVLTAAGIPGIQQIWGVVLMVAGVLSGVVACAGYWLLTAPDPGQPEQDRPAMPRLVARWGLLTSPVNGLLQGLWLMVTPGLAGAPTLTAGGLSALIGAASFLVSIAAFIGLIALFIHVRRLALRIPDPALESQTRIVMWGFGAVQAIALVWSLVMLFTGVQFPAAAPGVVPGGGFFAFMAVACVMGAAGLIFAIWGLILMFRYRSRFRAQAALARATWDERELRDTIHD